MNIRIISSDEDIDRAAALSLDSHRALRSALPFLPDRGLEDFRPRIEWMTQNGSVLGAFEGKRMLACQGFFTLEEYRNLDAAAFSPDWCKGCVPDADAGRLTRELYREACGSLLAEGIRIHAAGVYSSADDIVSAFHLTGFGTIVQDAARATTELAGALGGAVGGAPARGIRRASAADADELARLHRGLAAHIGAPPVSMPGTSGMTAAEWTEWLSKPEAVCLAAEDAHGSLSGFIKAEDPQMDVSFAVHGERTLAISGLWVDPALRGRGIARTLLASLVREALVRSKPLVSVDFETTNLEAMAFWTRYFHPVSYSMERRL